MHLHADPTQTLRRRYLEHLSSEREPEAGKPVRTGKVAGRQTRRGVREAAIWAGMTRDSWEDFHLTWRESPGEIMVWSDLHLDHENIIRYSRRPFGGVDAMNQHLLEQAIELVRPDQWLLMAGDLAMWKDADRIQQWMDDCPGRKALIIGNHDVKGNACPRNLEQRRGLGFEAVADVVALPPAHGLSGVWITHYPIPLEAKDVKAGVINLHGHTHTQSLGGPHVNACVEVNQYQPRPILDMLVS